MASKKLVVIAFGGNAIAREGEKPTVENQFKNTGITCSNLVPLLDKYQFVLTHGNGPQFGYILRRVELAMHEMHDVPAPSINADTQGAMGYMVQEEFYNRLVDAGMQDKVKGIIPIVTPVVVDANDPAFQNPTKFIGSFYTKEQADEKMQKEGWVMKEDAGRGWRRVIASPKPKRIIGIEAVKDLVKDDYIVITVGGGGIPVEILPKDTTDKKTLSNGKKGYQRGLAAVIDKDLASSLLAAEIKADLLIISTAVEKVCLNYKKPDQKELDTLSVNDAKRYLAEGQFPPGSMGPKIQAAIQYIENGGKEVIITSPSKIGEALAGKTGTHITP